MRKHALAEILICIPVLVVLYMCRSLVKRGLWVVNLTFGSNSGWADIQGGNIVHYKAQCLCYVGSLSYKL